MVKGTKLDTGEFLDRLKKVRPARVRKRPIEDVGG
jgi:hypothetical protein